jgi:hypothetical protein
MADEKLPLNLDPFEAALALHALRFYMNAKGYEVSQNTLDLEAKLGAFLGDERFTVTQVESAASILGARGGTKGGVSTSEAKKAAAAENGAKGGRPRKPNLYIKFHAEFWETPDPKLIKKLNLAAGHTDWQPEQPDVRSPGPYVRMYVPEVTESLADLLSHSMNVISWDEKPFLIVCDKHKSEPAKALPVKGIVEGRCNFCPEPSQWLI